MAWPAMIEGAIFDVDGLLSNCERCWEHAEIEVGRRAVDACGVRAGQGSIRRRSGLLAAVTHGLASRSCL
jgi:hypothetical protein